MSMIKYNPGQDRWFDWGNAVHVDDQEVECWINEVVANVRQQIAEEPERAYAHSSIASGDRVVQATYYKNDLGNSRISIEVLKPVQSLSIFENNED